MRFNNRMQEIIQRIEGTKRKYLYKTTRKSKVIPREQFPYPIQSHPPRSRTRPRTHKKRPSKPDKSIETTSTTIDQNLSNRKPSTTAAEVIPWYSKPQNQPETKEIHLRESSSMQCNCETIASAQNLLMQREMMGKFRDRETKGGLRPLTVTSRVGR